MSDIPTDTVRPVPPIQQRPPRVPPQTADGDTMERLFQALFYRIAVIYARAVPKHIRRLEESAILVMVFLLKLFYQKIISLKFLGNYLSEFNNLSSCYI
jgi:hypothetical protein